MASEIQVLQGMDTLAYVRLLENEKTERGQLIPYQTSLSFEPQRDTDTTKTKSGTVSTTSALETDLEVEFVNNISMNKYVDNFNEELENIYKTTGEEISPLIKEYNESRVDMINKACEKIEDPEKKKIVEKTLDNINDAYELKSFIEAAKKIKVKKIYFEKPHKVFKEFLYK